jgi:undecaprenyl diphosphate synthase
MRLIVKSLKDETDELHKNNIRLTSIGNSDMLPKEVKEELEEAFEKTKMNTKMTLNLALSYSGRWELTDAVKKIAKDVKDGIVDLENISEETFSNYLNTSEMPDPELVIRSGGEMRISNFLLWQIAYSEIFVTDVLWPKFKTSNLIEAINEFQRRERRFGLVSEQISKDQKKIGENDKVPN